MEKCCFKITLGIRNYRRILTRDRLLFHNSSKNVGFLELVLLVDRVVEELVDRVVEELVDRVVEELVDRVAEELVDRVVGEHKREEGLLLFSVYKCQHNREQ